jgi:hypothetical protein
MKSLEKLLVQGCTHSGATLNRGGIEVSLSHLSSGGSFVDIQFGHCSKIQQYNIN